MNINFIQEIKSNNLKNQLSLNKIKNLITLNKFLKNSLMIIKN